MIKRKKALIIISIAVVICILICTLICAIAGGFMIYDFAQKNPLRMPTWYVCKQIEKEIPIGTDADTVIEIMKSKGWSNDKHSYVPYYPLMKGSISSSLTDRAYFYSYNRLDYKNREHGYYYTGAYIGTVPEQGTSDPMGYSISSIFVFDENKKLMDIIVFRNYVGIVIE